MKLLQLFASAFLTVLADAFLSWMKDRQTVADEQALGAKSLEAEIHAEAAKRADAVGAVAAGDYGRDAVLERLRGHSA